jgi:hypothetical protein
MKAVVKLSILALALLAPLAMAQQHHYVEIRYKSQTIIGYFEGDDSNAFTSCRGFKLDLSPYPEVKRTPLRDACWGLNSADPEEDMRQDAAERHKIDSMLKQYKKDHEDDE